MLKDEEIATKQIVTSDTNATGISSILTTPSGDRSILAFRGINAHVQQDDILL